MSAICGLAIITGVFAVIPWANDEAAKQELHNVADAEGVYFAYTTTGYGSLPQLLAPVISAMGAEGGGPGSPVFAVHQSFTSQPLLQASSLPITIEAQQYSYVAGITSVTGHKFWISSIDNGTIITVDPTVTPSIGIDIGVLSNFSVVASQAATVPASSFPGAVWAGAGITDDANTHYGSAYQPVSDADGQAGLAKSLSLYNQLNMMTPTGTLTGDDLAGQTILPGVYHRTAAYAETTPVTFDAKGNPNALFIMQDDAALNTTASMTMNLINGAKAANIFWVVRGAATLGASSVFYGNILSGAAITGGAGATIYGRTFSTVAAVTLPGVTMYTP